MYFGLGALLNRALSGGAVTLTDPADIAANRGGQVTPAQKRALSLAALGAGGFLQALDRLVRLAFALIVPVVMLVWFQVPSLAVTGLMAVAAVIGLGLAAIQLVGLVQRWAAVQKDLAAGLVAQGPGHLVYGRGQYEVEVDGRRLKLVEGHDLDVGMHYHVFYLPASGHVLSAEPRSAMNTYQAASNLNQSLASANGLKLGALARNQEGRLAPEQVVNLLPRLGTGVFILLIGVVIGVFAFMPQVLTGGRPGFGSLLTGGSIRFLFVLIPVGIGLFYSGTALADLLLGRVLKVEGDGQKIQTVSTSRSGSSGSYRRNYTYYYQIGSKRFKVKRSAWDALVEGVPYRAYYTAVSNTLVNLESLASPTITL